MERYANLAGNSGVVAFEIHERSIIVGFQGAKYEYSYDKPGAAKVEEMKRLALAGRGLGTFITRHVKDAYASKEPVSD